MHAILETSKKAATPSKAKRTRSPIRLLSGAWTFLIRHGLCIVTVIVPTLLSVIYFGFIASKIYISESSFVLRSPQQQTSGGLGSLLQSTGLAGFSQAEDDAYTVKEFIRSRDALKELNEQLDLRSAWSDEKIDFLHRFGLFWFTRNFEHLYLYYQNRVNVDLDSHSDITDLKVNVFSADQAVQINELLLQAAERLVNKLNDRARQDLIGYATDEVNHAKGEVKDATIALSNYRNQQAVVDPEKQASFHFELITKLQDELIATKTELANLRAFAPDSPNPPTLELRAKTLQTAMDTELAKVAGNEDSLSSKDAQYQQLVLERGFAEQQLASAMASLETARNEAQRQQVYLEVVSKPARPDVAMEPKRIQGVFVTLLVGLIVWGIATMLIAGIREHTM
jgi:capsular polysaccharide transport system permease protein